MKSTTSHIYKIIGVALCLSVSYALAQAQSGTWSAPTATPPAGNVSAPIHVGSQNQVKAGGITVSVATSTDSNVTAQLNLRGSSNTGLRIFDRANNVDSWQFYSNRDVASGNSWLRIYNHQNNKDQVIVSNFGLESANNLVANGTVDVKGTTGGFKFSNRTEPTKLWQWYSYSLGSPLKNRAALYNHDTSSNQLWIDNDGLGVTGTVWSGGVVTGTLQLTGGSPAAGKVLSSTDAYGTVAWVDPVAASPAAGVYGFNARWYSLMANAEFRTWFAAQPGGTQTIAPANVGSPNDRGWGSTQNTANKLCQFFTNGGAISFTTVGMGSDNNNNWLYWDNVQNKWRWNFSDWNDATDIGTVQCFTTAGVVRGSSFLSTADNVPYTGGGTNTRDTY